MFYSTICAAKPILALNAMHIDMSPQFVGPCEILGTERTLIRPFPGVLATMNLQLVVHSKGHVAQIAFEGFLAVVTTHVNAKFVGRQRLQAA